MDRRTDFASELITLQSEVAADVGGILDAVKARKAAKTTATEQEVRTQKETSQRDVPQTTPKRAKPRRPLPAPTPAVEQTVILENVTTRLSRDTNELLTAASLHQRLKKQTPATRQDIIEEAVQEWLRNHEYL